MPTLLYTLSGQEKRKKSYGKYIHHMLSQLKQISQDMDLFPFYGKLYDQIVKADSKKYFSSKLKMKWLGQLQPISIH